MQFQQISGDFRTLRWRGWLEIQTSDFWSENIIDYHSQIGVKTNAPQL